MTIKQRYKLIVKKGPNPGHTYPIFAERITIGRDPMSDIIFKDPEVSRRHVQFARIDDTYQVEDLGSTNGTFVNGERLSGEPTILRNGQEIALGGAITLIFEEEENGANSAVLGTVSANLSSEDFGSDPGIDEADDLFARFMEDDDPGTSELDGAAAGDEEPHIDQLQSMPALAASRSVHSEKAQPASPAATPPPVLAENVRVMTNRQIMTLIIGTALGTMVCIGSLLLFMYYVGGDWLLNRF